MLVDYQQEIAVRTMSMWVWSVLERECHYYIFCPSKTVCIGLLNCKMSCSKNKRKTWRNTYFSKAIKIEHLPTQVPLLNWCQGQDADETLSVQQFFIIKKYCYISCLSGWSQTIMHVKRLNLELLGWCGDTWSGARLDSQPDFEKPHWRRLQLWNQHRINRQQR